QQRIQNQKQAQPDELEDYHQAKIEIEQQLSTCDEHRNVLQDQLDQVRTEQQEQQQFLMQFKYVIHVMHSNQKHLDQLLTKANRHAKADALQLMHVLKLNDAGKDHAKLIEKFLAKWLSAQILAEGENFLEDRARQLKPYTVQDEIQIAKTVCLADWIASPQ